jgi:amino acid transporter
MMLIFVYPVANGVVYFVLIYGNLCIASGLLSSVVLTSRYLFALGRDYCIPYIFSKTSKDREPWVADIAVVASMYISVFAYFVSQSNIGNICVCFSWWFTSVAYVSNNCCGAILTTPQIVPLGLYLFSDIDFRDEKTEFTLHKWGKPAAAVCIGWLLVTIIIGAMPISIWVLPGFRYRE